VTNLVQPIIRNTRYGSRKKFGNLSNHIMVHEGIIQMYISDVVQTFLFLVFLLQLERFQLMGMGFIYRGVYNHSFGPILSSVRPGGTP
jgi:hypothetical protein